MSRLNPVCVPQERPVPLAIVGGGAAGLFAAAVAASRSLDCLVLERKARVGAKLLMTANGRCNFTKDIPSERFLADLGEPVAAFARAALAALPPAKIAAGFQALGVPVKRMRDGRLFPASERAADIVHAFGDLLRNDEIPLLTNAPVTDVVPLSDGFLVATRGFTIKARNVLLATGGISFPKTGSVGDGQRIAQSLGHRVTPLTAGLTGFNHARVPRVARYEEGTASVRVDGTERYRWQGEVEFEPWGVTGAAVYNCQRWVARHRPRDFEIELAFATERMTLRNPVARPVKEAIVTMGGVALDEVDPATMMSRRVPGLFFAGEVLDIDGPTGGYNLTLAFATARLAVESACAR